MNNNGKSETMECEPILVKKSGGHWETYNAPVDYTELDKESIKQEETKYLKRAIENGDIDAVMVYRLAHLAKTTEDLVELATVIDEHDCQLVSVFENIDTAKPLGRFFFGVMAALDEFKDDFIDADRTIQPPIIRYEFKKRYMKEVDGEGE